MERLMAERKRGKLVWSAIGKREGERGTKVKPIQL